jgi:hypothetical protein
VAKGQFIVLTKFKYGDVSNPQVMIADPNTKVSAATFSDEQLAKWVKLGWIKMVP